MNSLPAREEQLLLPEPVLIRFPTMAAPLVVDEAHMGEGMRGLSTNFGLAGGAKGTNYANHLWKTWTNQRG